MSKKHLFLTLTLSLQMIKMDSLKIKLQNKCASISDLKTKNLLYGYDKSKHNLLQVTITSIKTYKQLKTSKLGLFFNHKPS